MSADIFTVATQLAILLAGRTPVWSTQSGGFVQPPDELTDGTPLQKACRTLVHVSLRQNVAYRSSLLAITSVVLSGIYTVTINGTAVAFNAAGAPDRATILDGIASAINADGTVGPQVTAVSQAISGTGPHDSVLITGDSEEDYSVDFSHSGAAVVAALADLTAATMRLWWLADARVGSSPPQIWAWSGETIALDRRGLMERFDTAGLQRLFVQVNERVGHAADGSVVTYAAPVVSVGPGLSETDA